MAVQRFKVAQSGIDIFEDILLRASTVTPNTSGQIWNDAGSLKFYNGSATKTVAFTDSNITGTASAWTTARTITLGGDLTGNVSIDGSANVTLTATIAANSVALGTDTTGNYVATITGTTNQVTVTGSGSESAAITLSLPQNIHTGASPTFVGLTLTGDAAVNGGDITTTATTFNLVNATATTINFGGAATALNIGAAAGTVTFANDVTVTGDLIVNGSTTTVNSTVVTIDDPVFTLGGDTAPGSDDGKDRGIEFRWHNGTSAKLGFFGFDDSTGKFTFIPDATNTSETFSGTKGTLDVGSVETSTLFIDSIEVDTTGATSSQVLQYNGTKFAPATLSSASSFTTIAVSGQSNVVADQSSDTLTLVGGTGITLTTDAGADSVTVTNSGVTSLTGTANEITVSASTGAVTLSLPATINANTTGTAASWTTARTITLGGDLTGNVSIDGSANVTLTATIAANSVALGTDTTGNYVASITGGTGVTVTGGTGEVSTPSIAIGQAVATTSDVTFGSVSTSVTENGGTATTLQRSSYDVTTSTSPNVVESHAVSGHTTVKYLVQAIQGTNTVSTEILAVYNNSTVNYTEYATVVVGTAPATFEVAYTNSALELTATAASSSSTSYRIFSTAIAA